MAPIIMTHYAEEGGADLPPDSGALAWSFKDREHICYLGIEVDDAIEIAEKIYI